MSTESPTGEALPEAAAFREEVKTTREENAALKARVAELERTTLMSDAGIPKSTAGEFFAKHYDGEMTAEAIKAAAAEIGVLEAPATDDSASDEGAASTADAAEQATIQAVDQALGGAPAGTGLSIEERLNKASSKSEIDAIMAEVQPVRG